MNTKKVREGLDVLKSKMEARVSMNLYTSNNDENQNSYWIIHSTIEM